MRSYWRQLTRDVLGIWIDQAEGAKFWLKICNELATLGVEDVIFVCVDGLRGLPEAIESVRQQARRRQLLG